ncbi:hypothetical protein CONPUDRAFT_140198 [Coniophora puteana RWD-64-598 SS2]|uniref:Uncharacterized protein n=1 Tax=Coniophora puteana (strain RWD-64-598) TaxID=741705 RepID=A0A5M3M9H5_CONPW|nr:uncharacterized protein CONPUDRAFT_140198 [Coniophora puteana RWD-64-598 SS2]EIW75311.1 hypothetical protein CONPUDRAFT_140198 [Coniophora puteana RWD-64-598 SS2]
MSTYTRPLLFTTLALLFSKTNAQYYNGYNNNNYGRWVGLAIAIIALLFFILSCSLMARRRRRLMNAGVKPVVWPTSNANQSSVLPFWQSPPPYTPSNGMQAPQQQPWQGPGGPGAQTAYPPPSGPPPPPYNKDGKPMGGDSATQGYTQQQGFSGAQPQYQPPAGPPPAHTRNDSRGNFVGGFHA